jgi:hypothetical protein
VRFTNIRPGPGKPIETGERDLSNEIECRRNEMKKWILATAALTLLANASVIAPGMAQGLTQNSTPGSPTLRNTQQPSNSAAPPEAPIGHRQPVRGDGPSDSGKNNAANLDAQDRQLDRMIKGICKGC